MNAHLQSSLVKSESPLSHFRSALAIICLLCVVSSGHGQAVFDAGTAAPTPGAIDISQLGAPNAGNSNPNGNYYTDSKYPGETFTMLNTYSTYALTTIYFKSSANGGGGGSGHTIDVLIYSMTSATSGSATLLTKYTSTNTVTVTLGHWLKFTGLTNILQGGQVYAFAVNDHNNYWELDNTNNASAYTGGVAVNGFPASGSGTPTTFDSAYDAAFDLNLAPYSDPLVTPTVITPAGPFYVGQTVTLSASFSGTAPFTSFVWQSDGASGGATWNNLPSSTTNTYSLNTTGLTPGTYQFRLIVTGGAGTTTNLPASMVLNAASVPGGTVTISPSATVAAGYVVTMSASLNGNSPYGGYQWQFSDEATFTNNIAGATSSTYTIYDAATTNSGYYRLIATNSVGSGATAFAQLSVTNSFGVGLIQDTGPSTPTTYSSDIVQLSTSGNNQSPGGLNYYWTDNNPRPGQTFTTGLNPAGYSLNALYYEADGTASGAPLTPGYVLQIYSLTNGSDTNAVLIGAYTNSVNLSITSGDWLKWVGITNVLAPNSTYAYSVYGIRMEIYNASGNPYAGGSAVLIKPNGGVGSVNYGTANTYDGTFVLQLGQLSGTPTPPTVVLDTSISPSSVTAGYPATMSVGISGSSPISYQWQFSDLATFTNNISGATNGSYTISDTATNNTGYYRVVATNSVGLTNSSFALLTVNPVTDVEIINLGSTPPSPSGYDIAQLSTVGNQGAPAGLNYYDDNNPPPGQTFTTGSNVYGYSLSELYIDMGTINGGHAAGGVYTLQIYSVSGGNATLISTYVNNNTAPAINTGNWTKWIGLTNILAPNTTYAYTISAANVGYLQIANATGNPYAGGQLCLIPTVGGAVNYGTDGNEDGTFLVHLLSGPVVPDHPPIVVSDTVITPSGVVVGGSATMNASFSAIPAPTYQWMFNNGSGPVAIPGATNTTYTLVNAQFTNSGAYYLVASNNPNGSPATTASTPAQFVVAAAAQTNTTLCIAVDVGNAPPSLGSNDIAQLISDFPTVVSNINYYVDNAAPPGQTFTTSNNPPTMAGFPLTSVTVQEEQGSDAGSGGTNVQSYTLGIYQVISNNAVLITTYRTVNTLGINQGDWIQFTALTNYLQPNATYAFSVHNNGSGYWKLANDEDFVFGTADLYSGGTIALLPANGVGAMAFSSDPNIDAAFIIGLTANAAPSLLHDTQITPSVIQAGGNVAMSAYFGGAPTPNYQWEFTDTNGVGPVAISGATNQTYNITGAHLGNSGSYYLLAWNSIGTNSSTPETLSVVPMILTTDTTITPSSAYTNANVPITLSAAFTGVGITYQWMFDNGSGPVIIPGATTATYVISNFTAANVGNYFLVASNNPDGVPSVLSSTPAALTALPVSVGMTINFSFNQQYNGTGIIVPSGGGTYWNQLQVTGSGSANTTSYAPDGSTVLGINLSITSPNSFTSAATTIGLFQPYELLQTTGVNEPFTFSDLPQGVYTVVLYSCDGAYDNAHTTFVIDGQTNTANANNSASFVLNNNYVVFNNVVVTSGTINGTWSFPGNHEAAFNGAQLQLVSTSSVATNPTNILFSVSGGTLTLSWPVDHTGWRLQSQTNSPSVGLSTNWVDVAGANTTNQVAIPVNAAAGSVFFRLIYP